jgi:dTDP-4-amino-4,6-dideoxygalactose transaminase
MIATLLEIPFVDLKTQYSSIREQILDVVSQVLDSGHFIGGEYVENFEEQFSLFTGAKYTVGLSSGTAAIELALKASDVGPGDGVIVPANSFFATAEAVSNVGAVPIFADVDPLTFHLDVSGIQRQITPQTKAVIPVHLYGRVMDLTKLEEVCSRHNLLIIEDAAQAHGTELNGVKVGSSGRLTCFSFYPGKNLGAYGDAGAVTCNDLQLANRIKLLRDHGSPAKYQHSEVGTNGRLDAIQAAILSVKLQSLSGWNSRRIAHANLYAESLSGSTVTLPIIPKSGEHNFHLFVIRIADRDALKRYLEQKGIHTGIHYPVPLHLTGAYQALGYPPPGSLPVAEQLAKEILSLPMYPELREEQIEYTVEAVQEFCLKGFLGDERQ